MYDQGKGGEIEGLHAFFKACIFKHMLDSLEWDQVVLLACVEYNFFSNEK